MPTRKIADLHEFKPILQPCLHPKHEPPRHQVYENGIWQHECPGCHSKQIFTVNKPSFRSTNG